MLIIRDQQMQFFREQAKSLFERELVRHSALFSPGQFGILGEGAVREIVRSGMGLAEGYGFTNRGPVRFYIEMMFLFGSKFDEDPQYPWAAEILAEGDTVDQMDRAERLFEKVMSYQRRVAGLNQSLLKQALHSGTLIEFEAFQLSSENSEKDILGLLEEIYPEKCWYIGEQAISDLVARARQLSGDFGVGEPSGISIFAALLFIFGWGCFTDPQFPWISGTLQAESALDGNERLKRLFSKARTYLVTMLSKIEGH